MNVPKVERVPYLRRRYRQRYMDLAELSIREEQTCETQATFLSRVVVVRCTAFLQYQGSLDLTGSSLAYQLGKDGRLALARRSCFRYLSFDFVSFQTREVTFNLRVMRRESRSCTVRTISQSSRTTRAVGHGPSYCIL